MKLKLILLGFILAAFAGCGSDDSSSNNGQLEINAQNLMGKWYMKGGTANDGPFESYWNKCETARDYQEFFGNDDLSFREHDFDCIQRTETSKWFLDGNELTVFSYFEGEMIYTNTYFIESITSEQLILSETVNEEEGVFHYKIYATRN